MAMVFQSYALYPHMRVRDNLAYGLKVRRNRSGHQQTGGWTRWLGALPNSSRCWIGVLGSCPAGNASASRSAERW